MAVAEAVLFILGLAFLIRGSDWLVKAAAAMAKKLGVSEFVIGLSLVAIGTSIPELASSVIAAFRDASGIVIGNVVGSNIANIGLVVGAAAVLSTLKVKKEMLRRDGFIMLFASMLFLFFIIDLSISLAEAIILLLFYLAYVFFIFETRPKHKGAYPFAKFLNYFLRFEYIVSARGRIKSGLKKDVAKEALLKEALKLLTGIVAVILGAHLVVEEAIFFAGLLQVPETVISISMIALGTSLPELMVTISAARKGFASIVVGNIIGSNIANIFFVVGVAGLIRPLKVIGMTLYYNAPFMILISILFLFFLRSNWEVRRNEGIIFLLLYLTFLAFIFLY